MSSRTFEGIVTTPPNLPGWHNVPLASLISDTMGVPAWIENDVNAEAKIALDQYAALVAFAKDPNGLAAKVERDRRAEMTPLEHGTKAQIAFRVLNVLTFGKYVHREERAVDMEDRLDIARRLQYHTKFLQQIAKSSAEVDITWNLDDIKRSLHFIAQHGEQADGTQLLVFGCKLRDL